MLSKIHFPGDWRSGMAGPKRGVSGNYPDFYQFPGFLRLTRVYPVIRILSPDVRHCNLGFKVIISIIYIKVVYRPSTRVVMIWLS